jgi:tetratricopeptide (TPR) repeat protein
LRTTTTGPLHRLRLASVGSRLASSRPPKTTIRFASRASHCGWIHLSVAGFEAFNRGELSLAQVEYERARKNDPRNTDVASWPGRDRACVKDAMIRPKHFYRRIIESDPQDTVAISALLNQRGQVDPGLTESRLKSLAADQPDLAAPHFSLGNLYARMGRWSDAQQAYFRAFSAEPDNPDILYNLAISLEHLRQNKLAAQYYAQARCRRGQQAPPVLIAPRLQRD